MHFLALVAVPLCLPSGSHGFLAATRPTRATRAGSPTRAGERREVSSYDDTDAASKGVVSALTDLFNSLFARRAPPTSGGRRPAQPPPTSPRELRDRLRADYDTHNYLWTGALDLACFDARCRFTDPTLSFEGTDTFRQNTASLVPLVEKFVDNYQSILLDIEVTDRYVATRWNMVGELNGLFWKPKIDVIGRTKFWYRPEDHLVYFYDEAWEIPAYQALLQIVTPANTFPNTATSTSSK